MAGWLGVDLDGTLAQYDKFEGDFTIGAPIERMVRRVRFEILKGTDVRIFTARVSKGPLVVKAIQEWGKKHIGYTLPVTNVKDHHCFEIWDDRARCVVKNEGVVIGPELLAAAREVIEAWKDCSASPGHAQVQAAISEMSEAIEEA